MQWLGGSGQECWASHSSGMVVEKEVILGFYKFLIEVLYCLT